MFIERGTVNGHMFGEKGPILVVMNKPDIPLFNYQKEVAQAETYYHDFLAKLEPFKPPAPVKNDPDAIGKFSVAGIRYIAFDDAKNSGIGRDIPLQLWGYCLRKL